VLSFSPRENHPIYSTHHQHHHRGSGTMSTSSSTDFSLNNYAYEQMNNVKNRENCAKPNIVSNNTNGSSLVLFGTTNSNIMNNNLSTTNAISPDERHSDSARILSEKNAIEKNLKKHSLFINALSWKRLSASHGKKKLESYNTKNKSANLTTFRPPALTDQVHPMMVVANEKNKNYQQQQIHFANNSNNNLNNNLNISSHAKDNLHTQSNIYFSPGPKNLTLDLQNSNNANLQHHHVEKLGPKIPLQLPLSLQSNAMHHHHHHQPTQPQSQQQQQQHYRPGPRKTIIQVS
jgi:cyclin-dependent kinase 5 activator 1